MTEALAIYEQTFGVEEVKKYIAPTATDKELYLFMNISKSYGLNPFKREIHFVKYGTNPGQTIVGYETYLKRAEKTGKLDGWSVTISQDNKAAIITINRKDWTKPFVWTVERAEFDKGQSTWKNMPKFMLKKVAIAQGFRLAFPEEIGGMPYIQEEINGRLSETLPTDDPIDDNPFPEEPVEPVKDPITEPQRKKLWAMLKQKDGIQDTDAKEFMTWLTSRYESIEEDGKKFLTKKSATEIIGQFDKIFSDWIDTKVSS